MTDHLDFISHILQVLVHVVEVAKLLNILLNVGDWLAQVFVLLVQPLLAFLDSLTEDNWDELLNLLDFVFRSW